jgi:hypothetical protein
LYYLLLWRIGRRVEMTDQLDELLICGSDRAKKVVHPLHDCYIWRERRSHGP